MGKGRTLKLLETAQRSTFRRARQDGGPWTTVAIVAFGTRMLVKLATREPEVVHRQVLAPGEEIVITHTGDTFRALAKREAAAEKMQQDAKHRARRTKRAARREQRSAKS